jgi:Subtilase family
MRKFLIILLILILLLFFYCLFFRKGGCCIGVKPTDTTVQKHWISWNLLFTPSSSNTSSGVIQDFETYLTNYVKSQNPSASLTFHLLSCPCDTLLTNLDATLLYGSGNSVQPPPTSPNPGPKGDYTLGNNLAMYIPGYLDTNQVKTQANPADSGIIMVPHLGPPSPPGNGSLNSRYKVLAVIDTGLDTTTFEVTYPKTVWGGNVLWQDAKKPTLFDVVIDESGGTLQDGIIGNITSLKHGTAVTQIVLSQIYHLDQSRIPKIMSIRAFDDSEKGSIYTVSCALSYAIQNKADFINASWGYFGKEDSVLKRYVRMANDSSIRVIAAAGNTPGIHDPTKVCNSTTNIPNPANNLNTLLTRDTLFFPACFAWEYNNLVSVTQVYRVSAHPPPPPPLDLIPCYYQNYSSSYITLGAYEPPLSTVSTTCCTFDIPFLTRPIEGSSFATPAMTAIFIAKMDPTTPIKSWISSHASQMASMNYVNKGYYFTFQEEHR